MNLKFFEMVQERVPRPKDSSNSWSPPAKSKVNWTPTPETTDSSENKTEVSNSPMAGTEIDWLSRLENNIISARANGKTPPNAVAFNPELIQNSQAQGETSQQELEKTSQGNLYAFAAVAVGGGILILFAAGAFIVYWQRTEKDREEVLRVAVDWTKDTADSVTEQIVAGLKNINESAGLLRDSIKGVVNNVFAANNEAENKQFKDAVREIEKKIGRKLTKDEIRRLHDAISGEGYGYWDIVGIGEDMFGD